MRNALPLPAEAPPPGGAVSEPGPSGAHPPRRRPVLAGLLFHRLSAATGQWRSQPAPAESGPLLSLRRARRLRCRGRTALLWAVVLYALTQFVLGLVRDRWHPGLTEMVWHDKWAELQRLTAGAPGRPLVVMLGSSRTDDAFQAGRLSGQPGPDGRPLLAYNFGVPMFGPAHQHLLLRDMLAAGIRPRLLLVEFLPPLLNEPHRQDVSEENWTFAAELRLSELVRLSPYFVNPGRKARDWLEARVAPTYVFRQDLHHHLRAIRNPKTGPARFIRRGDPWGYRFAEPATPEERARRLRDNRATFTGPLRRLRIAAGSRQALHDLLDCCRREQVPVAFVLMPESREFRGWYTADGLAAVHDLLADLHRTYGADVIDANEWIADRHFADAHHLLPSGAEIFTARLMEEVQRILARAPCYSLGE